jgi:hypothetical protein
MLSYSVFLTGTLAFDFHYLPRREPLSDICWVNTQVNVASACPACCALQLGTQRVAVLGPISGDEVMTYVDKNKAKRGCMLPPLQHGLLRKT